MRLICLGSGSAGNCYVLENGTEALVIEAGISFKEVKKALNFNIRKIVGVVTSHGHMDHVGRVKEYENAGIPIFKPYESEVIRQVRTYGSFMIKSFNLVHDVPCCGFLVTHSEMGQLLYVSDTEYVKYRFERLNHILVEANYSAELLKQNYERGLRNRVLQTHMELQTTLDFLRVNNNPGLQNVMLCHLSSDNADPEMFLGEVKKVVDCDACIATRNVVVDVNLEPF